MHRSGLSLIFSTFFCFLLSAPPSWAIHEKTVEEHIKALSARLEELENRREDRGFSADWIEKINITGLIEAEAGYAKFNPAAAGEPDEENSDIVLSTLQIGFDTELNPYVSGHLMFLWEEDETEPVDLEEGFISVSGGPRWPVSASIGKYYLPFGHFESFFITDPLTLDLGETNESALRLNYQAAMFDFCAGVFNGDIDEAGRDNHINNFFGCAAFSLPETKIPGVKIAAGVSYLSSIADSDLLSDQIAAAAGLDDLVDGFSAFLTAGFGNRVFLVAEYVGALDYFSAGELAFAGRARPQAWNTELAYVTASDVGFGLKYEGSDDGGTLLPETRYGAVAFCQPFAGTYIGVEYLWEEFENDDKNRSVTMQTAYQF